MMDLIFIIGIGLLFTLLVVIVGIYGYLRIFPWRQTVLSFRSNSYCEPDIHFAKIRELEEQLEIERKAKKFYNTLYILFVIVNSVVGVLLVSGFIQQKINPLLLGWIGIISLIFTLLNFIIRPEEKRKLVTSRMAKLKSVIRECKDLIGKYNSLNYAPGVLRYEAVCDTILNMGNDCLEELDKEYFI